MVWCFMQNHGFWDNYVGGGEGGNAIGVGKCMVESAKLEGELDLGLGKSQGTPLSRWSAVKKIVVLLWSVFASAEMNWASRRMYNAHKRAILYCAIHVYELILGTPSGAQDHKFVGFCLFDFFSLQSSLSVPLILIPFRRELSQWWSTEEEEEGK